jgi:DNA (cytosine-5)-methyltransferase 1
MPRCDAHPQLTHLSLFSGIGGADLAAEWAGIKTIAHSEINPFCAKVLEKNFPNTPNLDDIYKVTKEVMHDATGLWSAHIVSGGYPCQPFSVAGNRRGEKDDRYLWPEMLRVIEDIRPRWVVAENVAGHITMGLDTTLSDLAGAGYATGALVIPACAAGALHRRDRVFVVAHDNGSGCVDAQAEKHAGKAGQPQCAEAPAGGVLGDGADPGCRRQRSGSHHVAQGQLPGEPGGDASQADGGGSGPQRRSCAVCEAYTDSDGIRLQADEAVSPGLEATFTVDCRCCGRLRDGKSWLSEPAVARMADGVPSRVDTARIAALGNAICPEQIYPIFEAIVAIERQE